MIAGFFDGVGLLIIGQTIIGKGIGILFIVFLGIGGYLNFKDKLEVYKLSKTDMQAAKRLAYSQKKEQELVQAEHDARRQANKNASMYKCPNCGKQTGKGISVVSKSVSVGTVGLASNKIGKSYKCSSCGYM
jgi:predicted lipid-binding transport protein (Tim44 family)